MKHYVIIILSLVSIQLIAQNSREELWSKSVEMLQKDDLISGLELTNKYLKYNPVSMYAHYNKGIALFWLGDLRAACESLTRATELGYNKPIKFVDFYCDPDKKLEILQKHYYQDKILSAENAYRPIYTRKDTLRGALRPERTCFDVTFYNLSVNIIPKSKSIIANNIIHFKTLEPTQTIQLDLFQNLEIDSILHNGNKLNFTREYDAVWVNFSEALQKNSKQIITVYYHGKPMIAPNPPWDGGFVWKKMGLSNKTIGVACEQLGASVWWPNKDHLSDRPDSMGINIEVPEKYQAVCNGTLRQVIPMQEEKYTRYEWFVQYPINNYNATFYVGKFSEFTDTVYSLNDTLICRYHVLPKHLEIAKKHFKQAGEVLDFYNRAYGPFPFWNDNFKMIESSYEGMEHQTAIAYGEAYSNDKNAMTYLNKNYDYIIVHEAAHEWWGNSITAGDMTDAWIHEGLATYSEYLFLEEKLGYIEAEKELLHHMTTIFNFWPMVQNRNVNENAFASSDIYTKGAAMLHSLRSTINNDSLFKALLHSFYTEKRNSIVATNDFIDFTNKFLNDNYTPLFEKFLYETDLPILKYSYKRVPEGITFTYQWAEVPENFKMAFGIATSTDENHRLLGTTEKQEILLKSAKTFSFINTLKNLSYAPHNSFSYYWTEGNE